MPRRSKKPPKFANEEKERAFWESPKNDSTEYVDWSKAKVSAFPRLSLSTNESVHDSILQRNPNR